jgi:hypothetical protein
MWRWCRRRWPVFDDIWAIMIDMFVLALIIKCTALSMSQLKSKVCRFTGRDVQCWFRRPSTCLLKPQWHDTWRLFHIVRFFLVMVSIARELSFKCLEQESSYVKRRVLSAHRSTLCVCLSFFNQVASMCTHRSLETAVVVPYHKWKLHNREKLLLTFVEHSRFERTPFGAAVFMDIWIHVSMLRPSISEHHRLHDWDTEIARCILVNVNMYSAISMLQSTVPTTCSRFSMRAFCTVSFAFEHCSHMFFWLHWNLW